MKTSFCAFVTVSFLITVGLPVEGIYHAVNAKTHGGEAGPGHAAHDTVASPEPTNQTQHHQ